MPGSKRTMKRLHLEQIILFLMLLVFPLDYVYSLTGTPDVLHEGVTLFRLFLLLLFIVSIGKALWSKDASPFYLVFGAPVSILALIYLAVSVLGILVFRSQANALGVVLGRFTMFVLYLLIMHVCKSRRLLRLGMLGFIASLALLSLTGTYEMVTGKPVLEIRFSDTQVVDSLYTEAGKYRIRGLSTNPDGLAMFILVPMGFLLYFLSTARSRIERFLLAGLVCLSIVTIIGTASRAAWLGLGLIMTGFVLLAPLRHKLRYLVVAMGAICITFIGLVSIFPDAAIFDKLLNRTGAGAYAVSYRSGLLHASIEMVRQSPILGVGTGNFSAEMDRLVARSNALPKQIPLVPHNIYADVVAQNGLLGLAVYSLMHLIVVLRGVACIRGSPDRDARIMTVGILLSFLAFVHCGMFYPALGSKYGWASMGFVGAMDRVLRSEWETNKSEMQRS